MLLFSYNKTKGIEQMFEMILLAISASAFCVMVYGIITNG